MSRIAILLIAASLGLTACTSPSRFDNPDGALDGSLGTAATLDPASPAYFTDTVGDRVLFEVDQTVLTAEARQVLDGQAAWLAANPAYTVVIEGHADEQGTTEYNLGLSSKRAFSVQQYLTSVGVSPDRMTTNFFGKERPVAVCSDESCYRQNRRAVSVLNAGVI